MANLRLGNGTLTTAANTNIDYGPVPAGQQRMVKALTLCNRNSNTVRAVSLRFGEEYVLANYAIPGYPGENTVTIPFMDQVMEAGERIRGWADGANVDFIISGREQVI